MSAAVGSTLTRRAIGPLGFAGAGAALDAKRPDRVDPGALSVVPVAIAAVLAAALVPVPAVLLPALAVPARAPDLPPRPVLRTLPWPWREVGVVRPAPGWAGAADAVPSGAVDDESPRVGD